MKTALSVMLVVAFAGCLVFGIAFTSAHNEVNKVKTQLETKQEELTSVQGELADVQSELDSKDADLAQAQQNLTGNQADLDNMAEELTATESELTQTKYDLPDANRNLDTATLKNTQMADAYDALSHEINLKTGKDEDAELYVTPEDPDVVAQAQDIVGEFPTNVNQRWRGFQRLYEWVVNNIDYSSDTPIPLLPPTLDSNDTIQWFAEYWKMPTETMADGNGDCEDMANLLASLILSYNNQANAVWLIEIHNEDSGHVAVAMPVTGDQLAILDPAGNYYTGYSARYLDAESISSAIRTWLAYWSDDMPGAEVTTVYSNDFFQDFNSTEDFIQWAVDKYAD